MGFCKNCTCQSCTDERSRLERHLIKVKLRLSTESRTCDQIHKNYDKELQDESSPFDILYATIPDNTIYSVRFNNCKGGRSSFLYRFNLWRAKKNLLSHIRMVTNRKAIVVFDLNQDILEFREGNN